MTASTPETANDIMIRDFLAAWEDGDADRVASYFTDDAVYHNIPMKPVVGKTAIRETIREFLSQSTSRPAMRIQIHHQIVSGDLVMNERTDYFTVNGREIVLPVCGVFEIHDGLIKTWRECFDMAPVTGASTDG